MPRNPGNLMAYMTVAPVRPDHAKTLRIVGANAYAHFQMRVSSWYMAVISLGVGVVLTINPGALTTNPGAEVFFGNLLRVAPPEAWRAAFLAIGLTRLIALFINGTFPRVRWMPYVRASMAAISSMIWGQMALSIAAVGIPSVGECLFIGTVLTELWNVAIAMSETKSRPDGHFG